MNYRVRQYKFQQGRYWICMTKTDVINPTTVFNDMVYDNIKQKYVYAKHITEGCVPGGVRGFVTLFDLISEAHCALSIGKLLAWMMVDGEGRHPYPFCTSEHPRGTTQMMTIYATKGVNCRCRALLYRGFYSPEKEPWNWCLGNSKDSVMVDAGEGEYELIDGNMDC